jgi:DNA polymerase iota
MYSDDEDIDESGHSSNEEEEEEDFSFRAGASTTATINGLEAALGKTPYTPDGNRHNSIDNNKNHSLLSRTILHLDIDCFYCQAEELEDATGRLALSPVGIGQKHIIVTCNYKARARGVQKLMLKTDAKKACPELIIVDGSDLTLYRKRSREVYMAFREAIKNMDQNNAATKTYMDEMVADMTASASNHTYVKGPVPLHNKERYGGTCNNDNNNKPLEKAFIPQIYGDTKGVLDDRGTIASRPSEQDLNFWGTAKEREMCIQRLRHVGELASSIKQYIYDKTRFTVCLGVSVSPMLANISSGLHVSRSLCCT